MRPTDGGVSRLSSSTSLSRSLRLSILRMVGGSDRSVFANIKFTSQMGTTTEIVRASGDYIQGHLTGLPPYFRAGNVYLPDKAGGTVSFNAFIQPGISDTEREDFLEVIRPEKLDVPVAYGKVKPSDMLETHIDSPDYGFVYIGTMTVPVPEGGRIESSSGLRATGCGSVNSSTPGRERK